MSIQEILAEVQSLSPKDLFTLKREIEERVEKTPLTFGEIAGDLAGCLDGLPADLLTNPKHMEEFGK